MNSGSNPALLLFAAALAFHAALAWFIPVPGYMDAYYYFGGAQRLALGHGFSEPYLWNYLDDPAGLPHPSHMYWMPLTSIVAAVPMRLCGALCPDNASLFRAAQIPSVLLAALLPVIALRLGVRLARETGGGAGRAYLPWAAAWFALWAGFYTPFWANTDSFALYGVLGSLALVCVGLGVERRAVRWFALAGGLAGLGHLARADGVLLLGVALWFALRSRVGWPALAAAPAAYLAVMAPWFARNLRVVGAPLAPGGTQALWLTSYDDLFSYPASGSLAAYLQSGWGAILAGKWEAATLNLQTVVAVQGWIALAPFIALGLWAARRSPLCRPVAVYAGMLYVVMTLVFTFPGPRGGLLHSGAALLPFFAALGPLGLEQAVRWVAQRRPAWHAPQATRVFLAGLGVIAAFLSLGLFGSRILGLGPGRVNWAGVDSAYREIGAWLDRAGHGEAVVVVNNPPAFYFHAGNPAVVVPNGPVPALLAVADRYGAEWVILDVNVPAALTDFYLRREQPGRLQLRAEFVDEHNRAVYLYEVRP